MLMPTLCRAALYLDPHKKALVKPSVRLRRFPSGQSMCVTFLPYCSRSCLRPNRLSLEEQMKDPWLEKLFRDGNLLLDGQGKFYYRADHWSEVA